MKRAVVLLRMSIITLIIVMCIFIVNKIFNPDIDIEVQQQTTGASQDEGIVNIDDILPTVDSSSGGGMNKVNDNVSSDYKPVTSSGKLVTGSSSDNSAGKPASGSYEFDEIMYPYRAMLDSMQQKVYDQIYENANSLTENVVLCEKLTPDGVKKVMTSVYNDHPELFWLDTDYSYSYTSSKTVVSVTLQFNETKNDYMKSKSKFLDAAAVIINKASGFATDLEKEKYVYKALQNSVEYDENAAMNQSAYSALVNKKSVCAGYSRAFQYIMMQLNIPCYFCSGNANGGLHAWNIVKIDGKYYNVDISWDDSIGEVANTISYTYFNLTDAQISVDHTRRDMSVNLVKCN